MKKPYHKPGMKDWTLGPRHCRDFMDMLTEMPVPDKIETEPWLIVTWGASKAPGNTLKVAIHCPNRLDIVAI